jgi:hypothetical protein
VETFAAGNPDLQQELESLLQCRLEPANDLFFGKRESLLREGTQDFTTDPSHREELFLSYIDGELDESGRHTVEELVRGNPSLLRELELLRQTVDLPDPSIVFLNKEILYRPAVSRRVFGLPPALFRFAAAAVVLLLIGLLVLSRIGSIRGTGAGIADAGNKNNGTAVTPGSGGALHSSETQQQERPDKDKERTPDLTRAKRSTPRKESIDPAHLHTSPADPIAKNGAVPNRRDVVEPGSREAAAEQIRRGAAEQGLTSAAETARTSTAEQARPGTKEPGSQEVAGTNITAGPPPVSKELSSFATQALLEDAALSDEDGLAMQQPSPKKNILRGIFRKVSRVLEKTAGSDDPDSKHGVLIGNLQIALK